MTIYDENKFPLHTKITWTQEELDEKGFDGSKYELSRKVGKVIIVFMIAFYLLICLGVLLIGFVAGNVLYVLPVEIVFLLLLWLVFLLFRYHMPQNAVITLDDDKARIEYDKIKCIPTKRIYVDYKRIKKVYNARYCPYGFLPASKNRKTIRISDYERWYAFNGRYIVAEDFNNTAILALVYNEYAWARLKELCPDAIFLDKDEYEKAVEQKKMFDKEHDKYSSIYDGYVN